MNKRKLLSLIFFLFLQAQVHSQSSGNDGWFWQYPKPQGNDLRDIYIFDSLKAIAVGALGTVIKTYEGGITWDVQHHAGGTEIDLNNVHFTDSLYGWACGGTYHSEKNVLLKTTDGGKNWETVSIDNSLPLNAVYFVNRDTGIVVGEDGIVLRTTDGGDSWDIRKMDNYIGYYLDIFVLSEITFTDSQNGWIVGFGYYGNELYRTTDAGETWQWNELIFLPKYFPGIVDICFTDEKHGFIIGDYMGFFAKTTDGGVTWLQQNLIEKYPEIGNDPFFTSLAFTDSLNGWIIGGNFFDDYILKTTDGCESWEEVNADEIKNRWLHKIRLSEQSDGKTGWVVGKYGSIYKKSGENENWIEQSDEFYEVIDFSSSNENNGWGVGLIGSLIHTSDGGENWISQKFDDKLDLWTVFAIDENTAFAGGAKKDSFGIIQHSILIKTIDGGQSWSKEEFPEIRIIRDIYFIDDSLGWISGYKTTDQGKTWIYRGDFNQIQFNGYSTGWKLINGIQKTTNGGENWSTLYENPNIKHFYFINTEIGWAISDKEIYKTTDGGTNWNTNHSTAGTPDVITSIYFTDDSTGWFISRDAVLASPKAIMSKTTNCGGEWIKKRTSFAIDLLDIYFLNSKIGWAFGTGGIIKTISGGDIVSVRDYENDLKSTPENFELQQNFPNPFNPITTIMYSIPSDAYVSVKVYDLLGREVSSLINQFHKEGSYSINLDASKLASGIYFYRLTSNGLSITRKMILIR